MPTDFFPTDGALPFLRTQATGRQEPAKIRVAAAVLSKQDDRRTVGHAHLRSDNKLQPHFPRLHMRPHGTVNAVTVRKRQRRHAEPMRFLYQLVGMARAFEKRKVALAPEGNV